MKISYKTLADLDPGEEGIVRDFLEVNDLTLRLQEMGAIAGEKILVVRKLGARGPLEIKVKGYRLSVGLEEAMLIEVET